MEKTIKLENMQAVSPENGQHKSRNLDLLVFKMRVFGNDHYFLLDTGAESTMLAPDLISEAFGGGEPKIVGVTGLGGVGSVNEHTTTASPIIEMKFNLLGVTITRVGTLFGMFEELRRQTGQRISGLIGQDFLKKFKRYTIDNERMEFTVVYA